MPQQLTQEERHRLEERLYELKQEHRDLDDVINRLLLTPDVEELQLKRFKKRKLKVTCEVTPHHFSLTDQAVRGFDTSTKMAPPLRASGDRKALLKALRDGTVDAIATDHAPHSGVEKDVEFPAAANGVIGLETAASLTLKLVQDGELSLTRAIELPTSGPASVLGLETGTLQPGRPADLTIIDPEETWTVDPKRFFSKSRNTPFAGWALKGMCSAPGRIRSTPLSFSAVWRCSSRTS